MKHYIWWVRGALHREMAAISIASARRADPSANFLVMTDDDTDLKPLAPIATPWLIPKNTLPMMLANLNAQTIALMQSPTGDQLWFIDSDTIVLQPLPQIHLDLTVTWRAHVRTTADGQRVVGVASTMPYNYGVLGARADMGAREAFVWMRERVGGYNLQYQNWYGNQLALSQLTGPAPKSGKATVTRGIPWRGEDDSISKVRIEQLPCERFNYTPMKFGENVSEKVVLHFKGKSRPLMNDYAMALGLITEPLALKELEDEQ